MSYCSRSAYTPKINLDPTSSTTENLEALAPLIKSIQDTDSEQLYLRSLDNFVEEKEREIEEICQENYEVCRVNSAFRQVLMICNQLQDFVSSVSTLLTIRQGTGHLRRRIGELDGQMGDVGRALGEKVGRPHCWNLLTYFPNRNALYWSRKR